MLKSKPENVIKKLKKRLFLNIYGETELYNLFTFSLGSFKIIDIKRDIGQILTFSTWQKFERLLLTLQDRPLYNKTVLLLWFHFFLLFLLSTLSNLATLYHSTKERNVLRDHPFKRSANFHDFFPLTPAVFYYYPSANLANFCSPPIKMLTS